MAYAWSATDKTSNVALTNSNLTATVGASNTTFQAIRSALALPISGKWYWEVLWSVIVANDDNEGTGVATAAASLSVQAGSVSGSLATRSDSGVIWTYINGVQTGVGLPDETIPNGTVFRYQWDAGAKNLYIAIDSSAFSNPISLTGVGSTLYIYAGSKSSTDAWVLRGNSGVFTYTVPSGYTALDSASGTQTLTPSLFTSSNTLFAPAVTRGAVHLTPSLFTNTSNVFSPTVAQAGQRLQPALYANANSVYDPTLGRGTVTLAPSPYSSANSVFPPTTSVGAITLQPSVYNNASSFHAPSVGRGVVTLSPGLVSSTNAVLGPTVSLVSGPQALAPARFDNASMMFAPTVSGGAQAVFPTPFQNVSFFFPPAVNENEPPAAPGVYPLAVEGHPAALTGVLTGQASVAAGAVARGGHVIASILKGRP